MHLDDVRQFLDRFFSVVRYADDQGGIYRPTSRSIQRIGLALEPWAGLSEWALAFSLDAVFLHRPWKLAERHLPADVGVLAYHLAFDERLTLGYNVRLADISGISELEVLGQKEGRPLGMIGAIASQNFAEYATLTHQMFGGLDDEIVGSSQVQRVAVVGAMNDALVREAVERGANVYVTGQFRQPARTAVSETGIGVLVVGHRRSEEWGLRALAGVLRERWSTLEVILPASAMPIVR